MKLHRWDAVEREQLNPRVARRVVHAERMTLARIYIDKGSVIPQHSHENEQVSYVLEGKLRFEFSGESIEVNAGEMMQIASHELHAVEALEDSIALDIFQPIREDWLRGDDAYLRNPSG